MNSVLLETNQKVRDLLQIEGDDRESLKRGIVQHLTG